MTPAFRRRLILGALLAGAALWSIGLEPRWVAERTERLQPAAWGGAPSLRVAVASDWHLTTRAIERVVTIERAEAIVDSINAAKPDVILLPGDFLAGTSDSESLPIESMAKVLGRLKAPLGVYAVLGNHDWWHGGDEVQAALQQHGIKVLNNEAEQLPDSEVWIVGVGDDSTGHSWPKRAMAKVPAGAPTLVMMHDPASLVQLPQTTGLAVAGHTHGGQVRIPGYGALIVPGAAPREWSYGWIEHEGKRAYVTSGLGVSILPVRLFTRPEWVLFEIGSPPSKTPAGAIPPLS